MSRRENRSLGKETKWDAISKDIRRLTNADSEYGCRTVLDEMRDVHDFRFIPPVDSQMRLSILPHHWGILAQAHPLLRAWADLVTSAEVIRWLKSLDWGKPSKCENRSDDVVVAA